MNDDCGRYEPKQDIVKDVVGKLRKGVRYSDALQKGSYRLIDRSRIF